MYLLYQYPHHLVSVFVFVSVSVVVMIEVVAVVDRLTNWQRNGLYCPPNRSGMDRSGKDRSRRDRPPWDRNLNSLMNCFCLCLWVKARWVHSIRQCKNRHQRTRRLVDIPQRKGMVRRWKEDRCIKSPHLNDWGERREGGRGRERENEGYWVSWANIYDGGNQKSEWHWWKGESGREEYK